MNSDRHKARMAIPRRSATVLQAVDSASIRRALPVWVGRIGLGAYMAVLLACSGSVSDGTGPITPVDSTKPPVGTVPRGTISVRVFIDPADATIASAAGINTAGLTVRLTRQLSSDPALFAVTGIDGTARFENLLEGVYDASVDRLLTSSEQAQLSLSDRDASVVAGGTTINFSPPQRDAIVTIVASRRGSLVISELFIYRYPAGSGPTYGFGTYLEVYNAADTTIYLDGFMIANTWGGMHMGDIVTRPCESFNTASRLDSTSIWLSIIQAFPGSGREYPIAPGLAKVIAMDAMNHILASPQTNQLDLSRADFEQYGNESDIDNPFVPNMITVRGGIGILGRGYPVSSGQSYALLMPTVATQLIPAEIEGQQGGNIPASRVSQHTYPMF